MTTFKHPRWIAPLAVSVAGTIVAVAVGIGHTWTDALIAEIVILLLSSGYFLMSGGRGDIGAIYRHHTDERQQFVVLKASRLALVCAIGAAFICAIVMVAMNENYWQADAIGSTAGVSYFLGLTIYSIRDNDDTNVPQGIMEGRSSSVHNRLEDDLD